MREYRRRRAKAEPAKGEPETQPAETAPGSPPPTGETPPAAPAGPTLAEREAMLREAIGGTVELLADAAQHVWLDPKGPRLGHDRATSIGALWAPLLAPYLDADSMKWLPWMLASGGTANALYAWARETAAHQARVKAQRRVEIIEGGNLEESKRAAA